MRKLIAYAPHACVVLLSACAETERSTIHVAMVQLLASPEKYAGYSVSVSGHLGRDARFLFLTAEHAELRDVAGGLPVEISYHDSNLSAVGVSNTGCEDRFVQLQGVFELRESEYRITSVARIFTFDRSAGIHFEGQEPTGGKVQCWPK